LRAALAAPPRTLDGSDWERDQLGAVSEATQYLTGLAATISSQVPVEVDVPYGRAAAQILEAATRLGADGLVMATHGRTGLPHLLYGSVTEAVLGSSSVPVFVVYARPGQAPASPFSVSAARLLVPQDGSANDAPALSAALDILGVRGEIILVSVVQPAQTIERDETGHVLAYLDQQEEARRFEARDYLNGIAEELRGRDLPVRVKVDVRVGDPASGIAMAALEASADLIVMATHGRTGIRRAVLGSVAGTVLRTGTTPVLLVHPRAPSTSAPSSSQTAAV
ncbi:MAG TPA: universal stress protein, partial [Chloroflexota bacterium]